MTPMDTPTPQQAACLQSMFDHFNGELFNGTLDRHGVILCWTHAHQVKAGYYYPNRWTEAMLWPNCPSTRAACANGR